MSNLRIAIPKINGGGIVIREVVGDITINPISFTMTNLAKNIAIANRVNGVKVSKELLNVRPDTVVMQGNKNIGIRVEPNDHVLYYGRSLVINSSASLAYIGTLKGIEVMHLRESHIWKDLMYFHYSDDNQIEKAKQLIESTSKKCLIGRLESLDYPIMYLYIYN